MPRNKGLNAQPGAGMSGTCEKPGKGGIFNDANGLGGAPGGLLSVGAGGAVVVVAGTVEVGFLVVVLGGWGHHQNRASIFASGTAAPSA